MSGSDPWEAILERIEDGASLIGLDPDTLRILSLPERVLEVAVPIRRDNGRVEVFAVGVFTTTLPEARARAGSASIRAFQPTR